MESENDLIATSLNWSYCCKTNDLQHSLLGNNRQLRYKLAFWNCNRGLFHNVDGMDSDKLVDIKLFIEKNKPHLFCIIETDLHGQNSRIIRQNTLKIEDIKDKLKVKGYNIEVPNTWDALDQARLIVYVSDNVKVKKLNMLNSDNNLPSLTFEIGSGREREKRL